MTSETAATHRLPPRRTVLGIVLGVYALLVLASHMWVANQSAPDLEHDERLELPVMTADGPLAEQTARVRVQQWAEPAPEHLPKKPTVVLLHGSPGSWGSFNALAPRLVNAGYHVIAPDLPGFGDSDKNLPDLGARSHARTLLAMLDSIQGERGGGRGGRAHVVGWSNGGAVALHAADIAPERIASITLMASVGVQETEGSGSYFFEHAKYKLGLALHTALRWFTPHFGMLNRDDVAWLSNFDDSDLRTIREIMESTRTPTLILHGRHDFLTPAWGAELHHRLMPESRLVMLDASHFIPFMQADEASALLLEHFARHDLPGAMARTDVVDLAPIPLAGMVERTLRAMPWWVLVLLIALLAARWPELAAATVAVMVIWMWIDIGIGAFALFIAMLELHGRRTKPSPADAATWIRRAHTHPAWTAWRLRFMPWERRAGLAAGRVAVAPSFGWAMGSVLGTSVWVLGTLVIATIITVLFQSRLGWLPQWVEPFAAIAIATAGVRTSVHLLTRTGRQRLHAGFARLWTHEFWPAWAYYLPVMPWLIVLAVRHRGLMSWTCANPGVPMGGGIIGESKGLILSTLEAGSADGSGFADESGGALHARLIKPMNDPRARTDAIVELIERDPALGGWPVILKPDSGFRGYAVRKVADRAGVERYCRAMPRALIVQRYHAGPEEFGALWHRNADGSGSIFGITTKAMPMLTGDGRRTREQLVMRDPRFRLQCDVLLARLGVERDTIDPAGEQISLGFAGNHSQGCRFGDGSDLITLELTEALTRFADSFEDQGMDFGRFDLRCVSAAQLKSGVGLGIVELNGTTSEATHLYAPGKPMRWRYRVLCEQWAILFAIGARRREQGTPPVRIRDIVRGYFAHYRDRPEETSIL